MKFSSQLLSPYIAIPVAVEQLANDLTLKTCEVEEIFERKFPDLVVVGKVLEVWKHPNADTLFVTKIDCGSKGVFQICTGGENVSKNSFVPVALPGCYLSSLDVTIGERKMRGEESNGMICSKKELGFNEDEEYHWIRTLQVSKDPDDYVSLPDERKDFQGEFYSLTDEHCGKSLKEVFPWMETFVLDVDNKTLTHRSDLFGHYGLAQEIAGIYGNTSKSFVQQTPSASPYPPYQGGNDSNLSSVNITIQTPLCSFYGAISGTIKQQDELIVRAKRFQGRMMLRDLGLQPRHDWVNFTNLYMYMTGQPIHAFDADKISGGITVRKAKDGELFLDLTGKEYCLSNDDIVIADNKSVLALAGIYGGLESGVSDTTKRILIEVAHFDPVQVRKTGMRLGIRTDAQQRFEKNMNPLWTKHCFETMRDEWELDTVLDDIIECQTSIAEHDDYKKTISFDLSRCSKLIYGDETSLDEQDFRNVLQGLGFQFLGEHTVIVPIWRGPADITIEDDLVEEYIRIRGYETIASKSIASSLETISLSPEVSQQRFIEQYLLRHNVSQVETYPRANESQIRALYIDPIDCYLIKNPIDSSLPYMRPSMLWSMLGAVSKNINTTETIRLFDTGKVWKGGKEMTMLAMVIVGQSAPWNEHPFVVLKSLIEHMYPTLATQKKQIENNLYHPLQQADLLCGNAMVGSLVTIHPGVLEANAIKEGSYVAFAEICLDDLDWNYSQSLYETNEQLLVRKEAGFLFEKQKSYDEILSVVKALDDVVDMQIVDVYTGDRVASDKKSVTLSVKIDTTGKDGEYANQVLWKVIEEVKKVGGEMRG